MVMVNYRYVDNSFENIKEEVDRLYGILAQLVFCVNNLEELMTALDTTIENASDLLEERG